jgi:hypothetical protein
MQVVSAMLLLGGSAVVSYLTDMNVIAACFLLPLGVIGEFRMAEDACDWMGF